MLSKSSMSLAILLALAVSGPVAAQDNSKWLIPAGATSGLPLVVANENRTPAGVARNGIREIDLDVVEADWRIESADGPGLRVRSVAERGAPPSIPAPLLRVETGTRLRVSVRNTLLDSTLTVFGLHSHPIAAPDSFFVPPGETVTVEFEAGAPGTYFYRVKEGAHPTASRTPGSPFEREQMTGAFVVEEPGASTPDRVLVMNVWSQATSDSTGLEALTINGKSWPYTELMKMSVGDAARWRVVNGTDRGHPMHLHGFYFQVQSRGSGLADDVYREEDRRLVVTEQMNPFTTMLMDWSPTRPGNWLFHCHISFHVTPEIRLPGAAGPDGAVHDHGQPHMAGLVLGIEVGPGPTDIVSNGTNHVIDLFENEYGDRPGYRFGFSLSPDASPDSTADTPGPLLLFHRFDTADMTVHNHLSQPSAVHWHGLELDAWADGVPGWSASDGMMSPMIEPGGAFTYHLSMIRAGTFIYHSHMEDIHQISGGLYGPLVVLPEGETFDPETDHIQIFGWTRPDPGQMSDFELNGGHGGEVRTTTVGTKHRFRVINIAPAGNISAWMFKDGEPVAVTLLAKDGADLPPSQQVPVTSLEFMGVGETADFNWTPDAPGRYELRIGFAPVPQAGFSQFWDVTTGR